MYDLVDISMANVNKSSIFSEIITIDFYDSPTEAICKIVTSKDWVHASLVFFDPNVPERIFSIISVASEWLDGFESRLQSLRNNNFEFYSEIKDGIKKYFKNYSGNAYLFKCRDLNSVVYEILPIESNRLEYFEDVESALTQKKESQLKWVDFFIESQ